MQGGNERKAETSWHLSKSSTPKEFSVEGRTMVASRRLHVAGSHKSPMKSTIALFKPTVTLDPVIVHRLAGLVLIASAFGTGCTSSATVAKSSPPAPAATSASVRVAAAVVAPTPDDLLRSRLDAAMQESEALHAARRSVASLSMAGSLPPKVRIGGAEVAGRLAPELIQNVVRANFGSFRRCYEKGLKKNSNLSGRVAIRFVIARDGTIAQIGSKDSDLPDADVVSCIVKSFEKLKFPEPEGGIVTVVYPIMFTPGDDAGNSRSTPPPTPPPPPAPPPAPPPEIPPPTSATPGGNGKTDSGPIVVIQGSKVWVDGLVVGDTNAIIEAGRLTKLDALFEELKAWRVAWKIRYPGKPFVGAVGLRVDAAMPQLVFKSVFQTIAFAGYPDIFVQSASEPTQISEFIAQVPGPPDPSGAAEPVEPDPVLHMHVAQDQVILVWKRAATVIAERQLGRTDPSLAMNICESWKMFGRHPDASDSRRDAVVLHSDNALPWHTVADVARKTESCTRDVQQLDRRAERMPVFWTIFSVR